MRISDWSSDVCSSDLAHDLLALGAEAELCRVEQPIDDIVAAAQPVVDELGFTPLVDQEQRRRFTDCEGGREFDECLRSEESRVGKESVSTCRSRWSTDK